MIYYPHGILTPSIDYGYQFWLGCPSAVDAASRGISRTELELASDESRAETSPNFEQGEPTRNH